MQTADNRSFKELFSDLMQSVSTMIRKEIELARAETSENVNKALLAAGSIAAGGILGLAALIVLLEALVLALTNMGWDAALSALVVGGVVAIIGLILIVTGTKNLKGSSLAPTRTAESLRQDAQMIKEQSR